MPGTYLPSVTVTHLTTSLSPTQNYKSQRAKNVGTGRL